MMIGINRFRVWRVLVSLVLVVSISRTGIGLDWTQLLFG